MPPYKYITQLEQWKRKMVGMKPLRLLVCFFLVQLSFLNSFTCVVQSWSKSFSRGWEGGSVLQVLSAYVRIRNWILGSTYISWVWQHLQSRGGKQRCWPPCAAETAGFRLIERTSQGKQVNKVKSQLRKHPASASGSSCAFTDVFYSYSVESCASSGV